MPSLYVANISRDERKAAFLWWLFPRKPYHIGFFLYGCKEPILFLFSAPSDWLLLPWGLIGPFLVLLTELRREELSTEEHRNMWCAALVQHL